MSDFNGNVEMEAIHKDIEPLGGNVGNDGCQNSNDSSNNGAGNDCGSEESKKTKDLFNYEFELKKLKINFSIVVFIFYVMLSIFFGGMMLGLPWLKTTFYNSNGQEVCSKDIHLGDQRPPLQKSDQVYWQEYQRGHQVLTVSLVSCILLFLDVLMMFPILFFRNYLSMAPEVIYYLLDIVLLIVIGSTYKTYYMIPYSFALTGCSSRSSFKNSLGPAFYFAIARLAALKLFRIGVSIYFIRCSNFLKSKKKLIDRNNNKNNQFSMSVSQLQY